MRWDYVAITLSVPGGGHAAICPELDPWLVAGWQVQEALPAALDAESGTGQDESAGMEYVCILRRPAQEPARVRPALTAPRPAFDMARAF